MAGAAGSGSFGERVESYLPLFAFYLHLTPADVDDLTEDRFELFASWIDNHQAHLRAQSSGGEG